MTVLQHKRLQSYSDHRYVTSLHPMYTGGTCGRSLQHLGRRVPAYIEFWANLIRNSQDLATKIQYFRSGKGRNPGILKFKTLN